MSKVNHYRGYIIKITEVEGLSFNDGINKLRTLGYNISEFKVDYDDEWIDPDTKILWMDKTFYHMERTEIEPDDGILIAEPMTNKKNTGYNFELKYYNGGCGFEEALKAAIAKNKIAG